MSMPCRVVLCYSAPDDMTPHLQQFAGPNTGLVRGNGSCSRPVTVQRLLILEFVPRHVVTVLVHDITLLIQKLVLLNIL